MANMRHMDVWRVCFDALTDKVKHAGVRVLVTTWDGNVYPVTSVRFGDPEYIYVKPYPSKMTGKSGPPMQLSVDEVVSVTIEKNP